MTILAAAVYLAAIGAAEVMTAKVDLLGGIVFHLLLLLAVLVHSAFSFPSASYKLYLALGLAPLIRILSLSVPLAAFSQIYWYLVIAIPLLAATFAALKTLRYRPVEVGLTLRWFPLQIPIAATGVLFGWAEYQILRPEPLVEVFAWETLWLPALILVLSTGFAEELVFRGVMQRSCLENFGSWGLLYVNVLFALLHIGFLSWEELASTFIAGLFFSIMVRVTSSLLGVALSHGMTNVFLYLILPFVPNLPSLPLLR